LKAVTSDEGRSQDSGVRSQEKDGRKQKAEGRRQKAEGRRQKAETDLERQWLVMSDG
jgi:hypothetical protein